MVENQKTAASSASVVTSIGRVIVGLMLLILLAPFVQIALVLLIYGGDAGVSHLTNVLEQEYIALSISDLGTLTKLNDKLHELSMSFGTRLTDRGGILTRGLVQVIAEGDLGQFLTMVQASWLIALLRSAAILYSIPLFGFLLAVSAIDGWVAWCKRRTAAGRESGYLYHILRNKIIFVSMFAIAMYVLPPWYTPIELTIVPALFCAAIFFRYRVAYFKKYF